MMAWPNPPEPGSPEWWDERTVADQMMGTGPSSPGTKGSSAGASYSLGGRAPTTAMMAELMGTGLPGRALGMGLGMIPGVGTAFSALNGIGNAYNTAQNYSDLKGMGIGMTTGQMLGGALGMNGYSTSIEAALNAMSKTDTDDGTRASRALNGYLDGDGIGAGQGPSGHAGAGAGTVGDYQKGGYTGAGPDGAVQPHRRAGVVHEGEVVLTADAVRHFGKDALLDLNRRAQAALSGPSGVLSTPNRSN